MADSVHLRLRLDGPLPRRVTAGAATLPMVVTSSDDHALRVLVLTGTLPDVIDADAVLLVDPEPMSDRGTVTAPVAVVGRWAGSATATAFTDAYGSRIRTATFLHVRATVPAAADPRAALLDVALLLEQVADGGLGSVRSADLSTRSAFVTAESVTADGAPRTTHVSIVSTDADLPHVRFDAYGDGEVSTLAVPDRDAGSAAGEAYSITERGFEGLPADYGDPVRSALLRIADSLGGGAPLQDLEVLRRASAAIAALQR